MSDPTAPARWTSVVRKAVKIPMRDGVALAADLSFPSTDGITPAPGPFPALLMRTPYGRAMMSAMPYGPVASAAVLAPAVGSAQGYVVIFQDVRGTFDSEGVFEPMLNEAPDGLDTLAWIGAQPWSDGRVGTFGQSYMGGVQWMMAAERPEGLVAMVSQVPATDQFIHDWVYSGGVYSLELAISWSLYVAGNALARQPHDIRTAMVADFEALTGLPVDQDSAAPFMIAALPAALAKMVRHLPLRDMPVMRHVTWWRDWLDNRENPEHFAVNAMQDKLPQVAVPVLHLGGWYDLFLRNTYSHYKGVTTGARDVAARGRQRMIIGPWSHTDCVDCPPGATVDGQALELAWMDQWIKGVKHPFFEHDVVLYIMGENRWRAERRWPLPGTVPTRYYFHSDGHANTSGGDGMLSIDAPGTQTPDRYVYDPADPVPSRGGIAVNGARLAQNAQEARADVLCYTTPALTEDVEVTGEVSATLYAASSAEDTDWWVRLVDVAPDGTAGTLNHGMLRARYRTARTAPERLIPGEIVRYVIEMQATANVFKAGHRIRVEVSSSCFPLGERNPNAFVDVNTATDADFVVAEQTIHHDGRHASFIELPIIPPARHRQWIGTPFPLPSGNRSESGEASVFSAR